MTESSARLSDEELARASEFVTRVMGLHFPEARWGDLQRGIEAAAKELGFANAAACARELAAAKLSKRQMESLAGNLTVGETYFYRERASFEILTEKILPALIEERRRSGDLRLRFWSAACCTGEEAYTIAMLLQQALPDWRAWNITVLATDINPRFLDKAATGVYGEWSFRETPEVLKQRYFLKMAEKRLAVRDEVRRMVEFAPLNLVEDSYPAMMSNTVAMDVIFCRNVLMYFTQAQARGVIEKLHRAQMDGGWLIVGSCETPHMAFPPYGSVNFPAATLFRKGKGVSHTVKGATAPTIVQTALTPLSSASVADSMGSANVGKSRAPQTEIKKDAKVTVANAAAEAARLYDRGRYADAIDVLGDGGNDARRDGETFLLLTRCYANLGRLGEALRCCDAWIASDKVNAASHYMRAVVLQEQGAMEEAARELRTALYLDPQLTLASFALGNFARGQGKTREGRKHFENALESLRGCSASDIVPISDGVTAGRLSEIIESLMAAETLV